MDDHHGITSRLPAFQPPAWLDWRLVGAVALVAIVVLVLSLTLTSRDGDATSDSHLFVRIKNLSRLTTVEMKLSTVVKVVNSRTVVRGVDEVLIYGVCGRVVAGIDLSKIEQGDVDIEGKSIRIRLPAAEIFSISLLLEDDMRSVARYQIADERWAELEPICEHTYSWDVPPGMSRTSELVTQAQGEALVAFDRAAAENNIREMAQLEAEQQLEKLLRLIGYETIEFETQPDLDEPSERP